jgi:arylformamidase
MCQSETSVIGTVLTSGIYDLRPITQIHVNDVVGMDEEMAKRNSPALHPKRYESFALIAYGELELKTFREQSIGYNRGLVSDASDTVLLPISNRGHFDVLDELMDSDGAIFGALMDRLNLK